MQSPILFTTAHTQVQRNPLTGDYFVSPRPGCARLDLPYICLNLRSASQMAQTMDHYEETGERKTFPVSLKYLSPL